MASKMGMGVMHDSLYVVMTSFIVVVKGDGIKNLIFFKVLFSNSPPEECMLNNKIMLDLVNGFLVCCSQFPNN